MSVLKYCIELNCFRNFDKKIKYISDGSSTWLPVHPDYVDVNVDAQLAAAESHLKVYKRLTELRKDERLRTGEVMTMASDSVFAFSRSGLDKKQTDRHTYRRQMLKIWLFKTSSQETVTLKRTAEEKNFVVSIRLFPTNITLLQPK